MFKEDFAPFCQLLDDVSELRQLPVLSANAKALFFRAVSRYTIKQVTFAVQAHLLDPEAGKFKVQLQPAHIVAQIETAIKNDGRPDSDEAWGIALLSTDEAVTVVWTNEIAQALAAAQPILDTGDRTGARMAFKSTYERLVKTARGNGLAAVWLPSLGTDPSQREHTLQRAVVDGLLNAPQVVGLLPFNDDGKPLDTDAQANIAKIKAMLVNKSDEKTGPAKEQSQISKTDRAKRAAEYIGFVTGGSHGKA